MAELRLVVRQVGYEQLSFWLNPVGAIFTVGFSLLFLLLLGASAGSTRVSYLHNIKLVQYYVPGFIAYGVMSASFNSLAISLVIRRETGLLKRLRLSPLPTWKLLTSILLSTRLIAFSQVVLMLVVGRGRVEFTCHRTHRESVPWSSCSYSVGSASPRSGLR